MTPIQFQLGRDLCQIAPAHEGTGLIGLCSGRVVAMAHDPASVMRALIKAAVWRRQKPQ